MIKVLHVVSDLGTGGVEALLHTYYTYIDRDKIRFDFIVHEPSVGMLEHKFQEWGSKIYHVTPKKESLIKNYKEIRDIIRFGDYDIVHSHLNLASFIPLFLAKYAHVDVRINHSHSVNRQPSIKKMIVYEGLKRLNRLYASHYFAASHEAGVWLHGVNWKPSKQNLIVPSVIDLNQFIYNESCRNKMRKKLKLDEKITLLHVGRFSSEKNHPFLIDLIETLDDRYVLVLVGDGATQPSIKELVRKKNVEHRVIFVGSTHNVGNYMSAADIFLLPSKHEGFGIVLLEAQASDLPIIASDTIPKESEVTELIEYLSIKSVDLWVSKILNIQIRERRSRKIDLENAGYTMERKVKELETWIEDQVQRNR